MGSVKLVLIAIQAIVIAQVSSRATNISTTWALPQEAFPHFFRFIRDSVTWDAAKSICESYQAELLTVETGERRDAARAYLRELDVVEKVWIGLKRPSVELAFVWTGGGYSGGPVVGDGFWQEPPPIEPASQCVAINPLYDFRWMPVSCAEPESNPFVCQLPVPLWAKDCLVSSLPSLTITYLLERQVIELLSDCGLSGTKRIACRGGENPADLIKRLSCERDDEGKNASTTWSTSSRGFNWGSSTTSGSITSQMTHSSGTRHKRESHGTSAGTDSSLLSTSDSTWEHETKNASESFAKLVEKFSLEVTTTVSDMNEDQIEENRAYLIDQLINLQTIAIGSDCNQSGTAVVDAEKEPVITTSGDTQSKAEVGSEVKRPAVTSTSNDNMTQFRVAAEPDPDAAVANHENAKILQDTSARERISEEMNDSNNMNNAKKPEMPTQKNVNLLGNIRNTERTIDPNEGNEAYMPTVGSPVMLETNDPGAEGTPSQKAVEFATDHPLLTMSPSEKVTDFVQSTEIPTVGETHHQTLEHKTIIIDQPQKEIKLPKAINLPTLIFSNNRTKPEIVPTPDDDLTVSTALPYVATELADSSKFDKDIVANINHDHAAILREITSMIQLARSGSPPITSKVTIIPNPRRKVKNATIPVEPTELYEETKRTEFDNIPSTDRTQILKSFSGKNGPNLEKYQVGSSSKNILYEDRNRPKNNLNFIGWPLNPIKQEEKEGQDSENILNSSPELTKAEDFQTEIPVIVIAEMDEIEGNEDEDVEQVQPFTFVEHCPTGKSIEPWEMSNFTDETENPAITNVNSEITEAVPETGRPLADMPKEDSVDKKLNQSAASSTEAPRNAFFHAFGIQLDTVPFSKANHGSPRTAAAIEPKDTVSDLTTKVQTMSTPTQGEPLANDNTDDLETPKRPNRSRLYPHSGTLSFYPYFLNRVLG